MTEIEFHHWLTETYEPNDSNLLKTYAAKKMRLSFSQTRDISLYKNAITNYIYQTYKYQYNVSHTIEGEESDYDSLPDLIEDNDSLPDLIETNNYYLERETITTLNGLTNTREEDYENIMNASLENDIRSAYFFIEMTSIMYLRRRQQQPKKFAIKSILQEEPENLKEEVLECCICFESYNKSEFVRLNCDHEFCNGCLKMALTSDNRPSPCCAYCRREVTTMTSISSKVHNKMADLII